MYQVCILMATYNGGKFLYDQIDSLLKQRGVEIKILVRDDGSKDNTLEILNEYQQKKCLTWYSNGHKNVQGSFLDLCQHAPNADFYAFCDQDDVWDEDKLFVATNALSKKVADKPLLYYCGQRLVDENLKLLSIHKISKKRNDYTNFLISNIAGCTAVFNKKLLDAVNCCNPQFILMHDSWIFKICLALGGEYIVDSEPHINYRQHGNNTVGLKNGIKNKLHQMMRYLNDFKIQKQIQCLYSNYAEKMTPEYKKLSEDICNYDKSLIQWLNLLLSKKFNFKNLPLDFIVRLKILIRKL